MGNQVCGKIQPIGALGTTLPAERSSRATEGATRLPEIHHYAGNRPGRLVVGATAAVAAASTATTTATAAAVTATTAATTTVAATATAAAAAVTTAATRTRGTLACFVDGQGTAFHFNTMQRCDCGLAAFFGFHFDETKSARTACLPI